MDNDLGAGEIATNDAAASSAAETSHEISHDDAGGDLTVDAAAELLLADVDVDGSNPAAAAEEVGPADNSGASDDDASLSNDAAGVSADMVEVPGADGKPVKIAKEALVRAARAHLPELSAESAETAGLRNQYLGAIQAGLRLLKSQEIAPLSLADQQRILQEDPLEGPNKILLHQAAAQEQEQKRAVLQQALAQEQADDEARRVQEHQKHLEMERAKLLAAFPEWKDAEKAKAEQREIRRFLEKSGYSADEIGAVADARAIQVAYKAHLYDRLMAQRAAVDKKARHAPPYVKPGAATSAGAAGAAQTRFKQTGSVEDAVALLFA